MATSNFTPEKALIAIRVEYAKDNDMGKKLAQALLLSLQYDQDNDPPKPPNVNQVLLAAKPAARGLVRLVGVVGDPGEAYDWIATLSGAPPVTRDTFRQWYRKGAKFKDIFRREAYRVNNKASILTTYAEALHLAEFTTVPDGVVNFATSLRREFGI